MAAVLAGISFGLLCTGVWCFLTRNEPPKDREARYTTDACENCNSRKVVWTRSRVRFNAWFAICTRCGLIRLDVVDGKALEVELDAERA